MRDATPRSTYKGLPLTPEQNRQVNAYVQRKRLTRRPWDTPELQAMLADMLSPPELVPEDGRELQQATAAERETAQHEEPEASS